MQNAWQAIGLCACLLLASHQGLASGFAAEPYLLRLAFALERASNYPDTAARLASLAFPGGSSANPAGDSFESVRATAFSFPVTVTSINAFSQSDAVINAIALSSRVRADDRNVWSPAYAYTATTDSRNAFGLENSLRSHEFFLGYSSRVSPCVPIRR